MPAQVECTHFSKTKFNSYNNCNNSPANKKEEEENEIRLQNKNSNKVKKRNA
jgi:hypothetical protein